MYRTESQRSVSRRYKYTARICQQLCMICTRTSLRSHRVFSRCGVRLHGMGTEPTRTRCQPKLPKSRCARLARAHIGYRVFRVENAVRGWLQAQGIDVSTLVGSHCTSVDMWTVSLYFLGVFSDRLDPGGFAVHGCMCSLCIYCCIQHRGGTKSAYVATLPTVYEYGHMRHTAPSTNFPTSCFC